MRGGITWERAGLLLGTAAGFGKNGSILASNPEERVQN